MNDTERRLKELFRGIATDARKIAQSEIAAQIGTLLRGGKINPSALPYPQAGTTSGVPNGPHVGAVQPDGVTTGVDPDTGILIAAIPLDGLTTGTIAYFVAGSGPGTGWILLPIS